MTVAEQKWYKIAQDFADTVRNCARDFDASPTAKANMGTCNLDIAKVMLLSKNSAGQVVKGRVNKKLLLPMCKNLGLFVSVREDGCIYIHAPYTQYQGDSRTWQAEYIAEDLKRKGYNASVHYVID